MQARKSLAFVLTLVLVPLVARVDAQTPAAVDSRLAAIPRRAETQAVVEACRAKGREAETRHTLMVFGAAREILGIKEAFPEIASADPLTTEVAAMLHDIGGGGLVNAQPGAVIARDVLTSIKEPHPFTAEFIAKVSRIVETHHVAGTVKGKDDGPEWYVVLLADTPRIYKASSSDREAYAKLLRERIDELKAAIQ